MTERRLTLACPRCASTANVGVAVVPTMGDSGLAVVDYNCPGGCSYDDISDAVDAALGIRRDLG